MSDITAWDLIRAAAECVTCGKAHEQLPVCSAGREHGMTWASPEDGHPYRSRLPLEMVSKLRIITLGLAAQPETASKGKAS